MAGPESSTTAPTGPARVQEVSAGRCDDFLEQFAFPVSDLIEHCGGDLDRFTDAYARMKAHLRLPVESCRLLHVNMDMLDLMARDEVLAALAPPPPGVRG